LHADWLHRTSASDQLRFWRAYLAARPGWQKPADRLALAEIARRSQDHACRIQRGRAKRALLNNRDFQGQVGTRARGHAVVDLATEDFRKLLEDPRRPLREALPDVNETNLPPGEPDSAGAVRTQWIVGGESRTVLYRRFESPSWWGRPWASSGRNRALATWLFGHALRNCGIRTPRPLAVCWPRSFWPEVAGYLAQEWIPGGRNLADFLRSAAGEEPDQGNSQAVQVALSLGELLGRLHAWRFVHDDLRADNLLVSDARPGVSAWLLSPANVRFVRRNSSRRQLRDLARLADDLPPLGRLGPAFYQMLFEAYVGALRRPRISACQVWRDVWALRSRSSE
jgi:hypothetical protein